MRIAGIGRGCPIEDLRVEIVQIGQPGFVEGPVGARCDLPRHIRARRGHDDVIPGMAGEQFGLEHLVTVIDVVGDLDPGFLCEVGDRVSRDVIRPVVDVQPLLLGARRKQREGGENQRQAENPRGEQHHRRAYSSAPAECQRRYHGRPAWRRGLRHCRFRLFYTGFTSPVVGGTRCACNSERV